MDVLVEDIGGRLCVIRFVRILLLIMEYGVKFYSKYFIEYFVFFYEFVKMGEEEVSLYFVYFWDYVFIFSV